MAYWVCHCLFQRLFLCAGRHQVLTVHWRLSQFQSPVRLSSSEFLHFSPRLSPFRPKPHLPRFLPSSRRHRRHPILQPEPNRLLVPPSGFLSLPTVFSAFGSAGLFHPAATSRVCCPRASPSAQPPSFVRRKFPLVVRATDCCRLALAPQSTPPTSRPCSTRRCVLPERGLAAPSVAPLVSFRLPRAFPVLAVSLVPQPIRSWRFPMKCSLARSLHWVAFSVLPARKSACLSQGCRPAQGFQPSANFR